uniref:RE19990p n=1 Tax=Drosophila melanogaster TaxID=7227 RepID=D3DN24_DROME|nr:RE19990p [Drosophila melanogaster]
MRLRINLKQKKKISRDNHFVDPKTTENYTRRKSTQAKIRIKKYSKKKKKKNNNNTNIHTWKTTKASENTKTYIF